MAATAFLVLLGVAAVVPSLLAPNPSTVDLVEALRGPSAHHLLGTDALGRDTLARIVYGTRTSLLIGLGSTALAAAAGAAWGLAAALGGRVVDWLAMRAADILLSFPTILLALLVVAVLGPSARNVAIAIAVALSPGFARIVRAQTLVVRNAAYVHAAVGLGLRPRAIAARHVLPNVLGPLCVLASMSVGTSIVAGASLSFLGLGPRPPSPEWGAMLSQARDYLQTDVSLGLFPGLAITLTVLAVSVVGRELQLRFEGRTTA